LKYRFGTVDQESAWTICAKKIYDSIFVI